MGEWNVKTAVVVECMQLGGYGEWNVEMAVVVSDGRSKGRVKDQYGDGSAC